MQNQLMVMCCILGLLINSLTAGIVYAFHEGGVGYCTGCHILHDPSEGASRGADDGTRYMIKGLDPSSTCLQCHSEQDKFYNVISNDGSVYSPGGDFYWLRKTFTYNIDGKFYQSKGDDHGHNIVAIDYGLNADSEHESAPGGVYPTTALGCNSCHNPHGMIIGNTPNSRPISISGSYDETPAPGTIAGNFRLLGSIGYDGGNEAAGISFVNSAPVAVSNLNNWTETDSNHTAYGSGMSEWCCNCHESYINSDRKHSSGGNAKMGTTITSIYNSYVKTGDITGIQAGSYSSLTPFELGVTDKHLLEPFSTSGPGPGGKANVMCLTCHRAHASAFQNIGRWDFRATLIADSHPAPGDAGVAGNDILNSYYGRNMAAEFGIYQRQFCNKCHMQD